MKKILIVVIGFGILAGCSNLFGPNRFVGTWALSDDLDEYNGLYLYTLKKDGSIDFTHYPPNSAAETTKPFGTWVFTNGVLSWSTVSGQRSLSFKKYKGTYVTTNYAIPRTTILIDVDMSDGRPIIDY